MFSSSKRGSDLFVWVPNMSSMGQSRLLVTLGLLGLFLAIVHGRVAPVMAPAGANSSNAGAAPAPVGNDDLNLLFIQQARSGRLVMNKNSRGEGRLVLKGVSQHTIWFADRPGRSAGQVETSFFVGSNFTDAHGDWLSKPNAALYISKPGPRASTDIIVIVTLSSPAYDATNGTLSYKVSIVPGNSTLGSKQPMPRPKRPTVGSLVKSYLQVAQDPTTPTLLSEIKEGELVFDSAVLFIDHWGWWGWGWGWRWGRWGWWGK